jgi:hypothetical protein
MLSTFVKFFIINKLFEMQDIIATFQPFLTFLYILGFFPYFCNGSLKSGCFKLKFFGVLATLGHFLLMISLIVLNILNKVDFRPESYILSFVWKYIALCSTVALVLMFIYQHVKMRKFEFFLLKINEFDENVSKNSYFKRINKLINLL